MWKLTDEIVSSQDPSGKGGSCEIGKQFLKCYLFIILPVFSFAIHQKIVKKKKHPFLNISRRNFQ